MRNTDRKINPNKVFYSSLLEIGARIIIPLMLLIFIGLILDRIYQSKYTFLFIALGISVITSLYGVLRVYRKARVI